MATTTMDPTAVDATRKVLSLGDWFEPLTVKAEIEVLRKILAQSPRPDLTAQITVAGQIISLKKLLEDLSRFNRALNNQLDGGLFTDLNSIKIEHLTLLENNLAEIIAPPEIKESMDAVVPANLQELLEAQAKVTAEKKQALGRPPQLEAQIKHAQEIGIRAQLLRVSVSKNLFVTLTESSYIRDLQTIYGKEAVNQLLAQRIDSAVNKSVTALALNQLGVSGPSGAAAYFAAQLEKNLKSDRDLLATALAKTHKADRKNAMTDAKNLAEETAKEVDPAARAFKTEQDSSPLIKANAEKIAHGEAEAALSKAGQRLSVKQTSRLIKTLAEYHGRPDKQLLILKRILPAAAPEARQQLIESLTPAISVLARSSGRPTVAETTTADSLVVLARTNPEFFPFRFAEAVRSGKLSTVEAGALMARMSQESGIPIDYVAMRLAGVTAKNLEIHLNNLAKGQPVLFGLPTQPRLGLNHPVFSRLISALPEIQKMENSGEEFRAINLGLQNSWQLIAQTLDFGKAVRYNFNRLPPVNRMFSSAQTVFSGLRVQSETVNSVFNFFSTAGRGFGKLGSAATAPFRAVGSAISAGFNNVKTWAGTQIKSGLAKAGAWLAKKGVVKAATKLGLLAVGKGAAALIAQAAPGIGTAVGILTGLSVLGDIGQFVWNNREGIGTALAGGLFFGQTLLSGLFGLLGQFGGLAFSTGGGALIGTLILPGAGTAIGAGLGFATGLGIQAAGGLGSVLSGAGSALGSAALGLGNMAALLGAPGLIGGLGSTIAATGIAGIALGAIITVFFVQPTTNAGLFVPGGQSGGVADFSNLARKVDWTTTAPEGCPSNWPTLKGDVLQGPSGLYSHRIVTESLDILGTIGTPVYATHKGKISFQPNLANIGNYGSYASITSACLGGQVISMYTHLSAFNDREIHEGADVQPGTLVGLIGVSGCPGCDPHLHYQFGLPIIGSIEMAPPSIPASVPRGCCYIGPGRLRGGCVGGIGYSSDRAECFNSISW